MSTQYIIANSARAKAFAVNDTKHCVAVVHLSTQDNVKLLKSGTIKSNKYQSKGTIEKKINILIK